MTVNSSYCLKKNVLPSSGVGQRVKTGSPAGFTFPFREAGVRRGLEIATETQATPALRSKDLISKTFLPRGKKNYPGFVCRVLRFLSFCNNDG